MTCVPVDAFPATYSWAKIVLSFMRSQRGLALFKDLKELGREGNAGKYGGGRHGGKWRKKKTSGRGVR